MSERLSPFHRSATLEDQGLDTFLPHSETQSPDHCTLPDLLKTEAQSQKGSHKQGSFHDKVSSHPKL